MLYLPPDDISENEQGFVLVTALLILIVLLVIGTAATRSTDVEKMISSNDRTEKLEFFNQETCLGTSKMLYTDWLTTGFITTGETVTFFPPAVTALNDLDGDGINDISEINDPNGVTLASYEARAMEITGTPVASLSDDSNDFPPMDHKDKPPPGSGFSPKNFEVRRYIVTCQSASTDRVSVLQEGVYKVFNKF